MYKSSRCLRSATQPLDGEPPPGGPSDQRIGSEAAAKSGRGNISLCTPHGRRGGGRERPRRRDRLGATVNTVPFHIRQPHQHPPRNAAPRCTSRGYDHRTLLFSQEQSATSAVKSQLCAGSGSVSENLRPERVCIQVMACETCTGLARSSASSARTRCDKTCTSSLSFDPSIAQSEIWMTQPIAATAAPTQEMNPMIKQLFH